MILKLKKLTAVLAAVLLFGGASPKMMSGSFYVFADEAESESAAQPDENGGEVLPNASDDIPDTGAASAGLTSIVAVLFATACIVAKKEKDKK